MQSNNSLKRVSELYMNSADFYRILDLYLDLSCPIKVLTHSRKDNWSFQAMGMGKDGEPQRIIFTSRSGIAREWESPRRRLPLQLGKIYWMLSEMGYEVGAHCLENAKRYEHYAVHGISNLKPNENRQVMIERLQEGLRIEVTGEMSLD